MKVKNISKVCKMEFERNINQNMDRVTVLVGHRGVGKTELVKRLTKYFESSQTLFFDLDYEISSAQNRSLLSLFNEVGEEEFRLMEISQFRTLIESFKNHQIVISLGAGFPVGELLGNFQIIWIRRSTDADGRIFLDRPRLSEYMSRLDEYHQRFLIREKVYSEYSHSSVLIPEGVSVLTESDHRYFAVEKALFGRLLNIHVEASDQENLNAEKAIITVLSDFMRTSKRWSLFLKRFKGIPNISFELRDDLLSHDEIKKAVVDLEGASWIYSFRKDKKEAEEYLLSKEGFSLLIGANLIDWPLEFGAVDRVVRKFNERKIIFSLHEIENIEEALHRVQFVEKSMGQIKLSPKIEKIADLIKLLNWQKMNSVQRSILPRSENGKWQWFRGRMKGFQKLNFICETQNVVLDQPDQLQWQMIKPHLKHFGAVIGHPVRHSYSPMEQYQFFVGRGLNFFKIDLDPEEYDIEMSFRDLKTIGLIAAAITAPFKREAANISTNRTDLVETTNSANTLGFSISSGIHSTNTDVAGLRALTSHIEVGETVCVWGGGGVIESISLVIPSAHFFSSRTGAPKSSTDELPNDYSPDVVIWAAPSSLSSSEIVHPPEEWDPRLILDLNYSENSFGREYALEKKALYISGVEMFKVQAQGQRTFWDEQFRLWDDVT